MPEFDSTISYKPIPLFPAYCAGSDGTIWTKWKRTLNRQHFMSDEWRQMNPTVNTQGYLVVSLYPGNKIRQVHRLVLEAFVGLRPKGMVCRHFPDRNKTNNLLSNIQWGTHGENRMDAVFHGTAVHVAGEQHGRSKLTNVAVMEILELCRSGTVTQAFVARKYGIHQSVISRIVHGKKWKHLTANR